MEEINRKLDQILYNKIFQTSFCGHIIWYRVAIQKPPSGFSEDCILRKDDVNACELGLGLLEVGLVSEIKELIDRLPSVEESP